MTERPEISGLSSIVCLVEPGGGSMPRHRRLAGHLEAASGVAYQRAGCLACGWSSAVGLDPPRGQSNPSRSGASLRKRRAASARSRCGPREMSRKSWTRIIRSTPRSS